MPRKPQQLAKLSRPRLYDVLPRERLFAILDEKCRHPAVCLVGPPGAGKTTLVSSWLDRNAAKGIWYQVDTGDADLATVFYYLGQAASPFMRREQPPLPVLTPEYLQDLATFSRRFFRELFSRMPLPSTFVLDNYQEIAPDSVFHETISDAIQDLPHGMTLILLTRQPLPKCYARLIANECIHTVDWEQLKLSQEEAHGIAIARAGVSTGNLEALYEQSEGWVAGFVLMLEEFRRKPDRAPAVHRGRDAIFDYFAGQLFDGASPEMQSLMMRLSFLPRMSASAVNEFSGNEKALALLEDMHRRHLFTYRHQAREPVYQFHSLLRAFLQGRANQSLDPTSRIELTSASACMLDESGHAEDALPLFVAAGEYVRARTVIVREAPKFIQQGRWTTIIEWIDMLPPTLTQRDCWLAYWLGVAIMFSSPRRAREVLERSFELAERDNDGLCRLLSAAGVINTHLAEHSEFRPLDRWIVAIERDFSPLLHLENTEYQLYIQSAFLVALAFRQPSNPRLPDCVERVFELLDGDIDVNLRLSAVTALIRYGSTTGPLEVGRRGLRHLEPLLGSKGATAFNVASALAAASWLYCLTRNSAACLEASLQAEHISEEHGLISPAKVALINRMWLRLFELDASGSSELLAKLEGMLDHTHPFDIATLHGAKAWIALSENRPKEALEFIIEAVGVFDRVGSTMHRINFRLGLITILVVNRHSDPARHEISKVREMAGLSITDWQRNALLACEAAIALEEGDAELSLEKFRTAIGQARACGDYFSFANWCGLWMPRLCQMALVAGIEAPYVKELIRRHDVPQPLPGVENWPWPVKIYTLGEFRVEVDDKPLLFSRKAPRKVLALLKAIIAFGARVVPEQRLMDALWTDESGEAAHEALAASLYRLRKLLVHPDVVQLSDGLISIDPGRCWVDAWALERRLEDHCEYSPERKSEVESILRLYEGPFLAEDLESPWALPMRERLRGKVLRHVSSTGREYEDAGELGVALSLYQKGIEADNLAEDMYQGLMRCYRRMDRIAEALSVYRRLRQTLSLTLGIQPSAQTEHLMKTIKGA